MKKITLGLIALFIMTFSGCATEDVNALTRVSFDINPSFEVVLNSSGEVTDVLTKNDDASALVSGIDFSEMSLDDVLGVITTKAIEAGYLTEDNLEDILISFEDSQDDATVEEVTNVVSDVLLENDITAQINTQKVVANAIDKEQADALNISLGRYELLSKIADNTSQDITTLANRSITDIMNDVVASGQKLGNVLRNSRKFMVMSDDVSEVVDSLNLALESKSELINERVNYDLKLSNGEITEDEYNAYVDNFVIQMENVNNTISEYRQLLNGTMNQSRADNYYEDNSIKSETKVGIRVLLDEVERLTLENANLQQAYENGEITEAEYNLQLSANQATIESNYNDAKDIIDECNLDDDEKADLLSDLENDYQDILNGDEASNFIRNEFNELKEKYYNGEITLDDFLAQAEQVRNNINTSDLKNARNVSEYIDRITKKAMIKNNYAINNPEINDLLEAYKNGEITIDEYQDKLEEIQGNKNNGNSKRPDELDAILNGLDSQYKNNKMSTDDYDRTLKALGNDKAKNPKSVLNDLKEKAKKENNRNLYDSVTCILDPDNSEDL